MSLIADMNRVRPLPTVERERNALLANAAFAAVVLGGLWMFEIPLVFPGAVIGLMLVLLGARFVHRVIRGDEPAPGA